MFPKRCQRSTTSTKEDWVEIMRLDSLVASLGRTTINPHLLLPKVRQRTQATSGTMRTSTSTPCRKDTVLGQFLDQPCRSHTCENWNGHTIASTLFAKFGLNSFDTCIRHIGALLAWLPRSGWTFHVATCFSSLWGRPLASGSVLHRLLWHG